LNSRQGEQGYARHSRHFSKELAFDVMGGYQIDGPRGTSWVAIGLLPGHLSGD